MFIAYDKRDIVRAISIKTFMVLIVCNESQLKNMSILTITPTRGADGSVDVAGSIAAFETALTKFIAENEVESKTIAEAVLAVFEQFKGTNILVPAVVGMALQRLNVQPGNFTAMEKKVHQYVSSNSQGDTKDGVQENPESLFVIGRGRNGGARLRSDIPVTPTE